MDGVYVVQGGALNFNTSTNTISVTGTISGLSLTSQTLLTGSFNSFGALFVGSTASFYGDGPDTKSAALLRALGVPTTTPFAFFGFSTAFNWNGTSGTAISTDITNSEVPEPGSMLLLGTGLLGLGTVVRRRLRKN